MKKTVKTLIAAGLMVAAAGSLFAAKKKAPASQPAAKAAPAASDKSSCAVASVPDQCAQRPDEYRSAACERGRRDTADSGKCLSENRRAAFAFAVHDDNSHAGTGNDAVRIRRNFDGHPCRSHYFFCRIYYAAVLHSDSRAAA